MSHEMKGLYKLGGVAFIASGMLFLVRGVLELEAGPPPSSGVDILAWVQSAKLLLSFVSEVLFFAAVALVPAVAALYFTLAESERAKAVTGCGIIAVTIPIIAMSLVVHGRLVYPVYGISVTTPAVAEYSVAVFYGGMHAVGLMLGLATIILSLAMRRGPYGVGVAWLGFVTGALDIVGAYADLIGPALTLVCQVFLAAWFVVVGAKLYRLPIAGVAMRPASLPPGSA